MAISIQTNVASLIAQQNLSTNGEFQTKTIAALTSGYRINQSGDDAAGLAVANKLRSSVAELTQGVLNANDGVSQLQIVDGGLNNISTMLDRLKTLATQSASTTFTGDRSNINVEYQQLVQDITRQASNIGLNSGGTRNVSNSVYIGGGTQANSQVVVDLSGGSNAVDATSLGINNTTVAAGGTTLTGNNQRLDAPGASFLTSGSQAFTFQVFTNGAPTQVTATVTGTASGLTESAVLSQLNGTLNQYGITAQVGSDGKLQFGGATPFSVAVGAASAGTAVATNAAKANNTGVYSAGDAAAYAATAADETLTFQNGQALKTVTITLGSTVATAIADINSAVASIGIYAVKGMNGGVSLQSASTFTVSSDVSGADIGKGVLGDGSAEVTTVTSPSSTASTTGNALAAITAINNALAQLGNVQSVVGAGENKLQYAMNLANSQVTNFSAAESRIRDADVAAEAANLTKAQVLQQASIAAMAQANAAPQAVLSLLKG